MEESEIIKQLLHYTDFDYSKYKDLPLGVIVVTKAGTLIRQNERAKIEFENTIHENESILGLFSNPEERKRIFEYLENENDGYWLTNRTITYRINGKYKKLKFSINTYKKNGYFLGVLTLVFPSPPSLQFEELLPIGLFEVANDNKIIFKNSAFDSILSIPENISESLLLTKFIDKDKLKEIFIELSKNKKLENAKVNVKDYNNEPLIINVNLVVEESELKEINGKEQVILYNTKGSIEDITYNDILVDVPNSLFILGLRDNDLIIKSCTEGFSKIFDLEMSECKNKNFRELINNEHDYPKLFNAIKELTDDYNEINLSIKIFTKIKAKEISILIKKRSNHNVAFTGLLNDVTDDVDRQLTEWKKDFASLLHTYSAVNNNVVYTTSELIIAHETEIVKDGVINTAELIKRINSLLKGLNSIYKNYSEQNQGNPLFEEIDIRINMILKKLDVETDLINNENYSVALMRNNLVNIRRLLIQSYNVNQFKGQKQDLKFHVSEILRYLRLLSLKYLNEQCSDLAIDIDEFRNVLRNENYVSKKANINVIDVVRRAKDALGEYAVRKNLSIQIKPEIFNEGKIYANEIELYTVFYNILNNAIKYSWSSKNIKKVNVHLELMGKDLIIIFENFGTEITQDEINNGELFKFGLRGYSAKDRASKRSGTGMGLWHANKNIVQMGGSIQIECKPYTNINFSETNKIFQTKFIVKIPKK